MAEIAEFDLTNGRVLARNTILNLIGQGAPMIVAIFAIPMLIKGLGTDRFGVLTLAWMATGYFSLFDLGLGRALTKLVAERLGSWREDEIPALVWTSLLLMIIMGFVGTLLVVLISPWLVNDILKVPIKLKTETQYSFYLLAVSIPVVISTTGLSGILAAYQRFDLINAVRIPLGIFTFLGPLIILIFSNRLFFVVAVLIIGRLIALFVYLLLCFLIAPALRYSIVVRRSVVRPLISFGSWMTVTNIVGPLMVYLDRFLIGAQVSMNSVAYYATPQEIVNKFSLFPAALVGVLFPAFASTSSSDRNRFSLLYNRGVKYVFAALFPVTLLVVTLAHEVLGLWLGREFVENSTIVLQLLAIGVLLNCLALIPFTLLQGAGRPDLTSKLHLVELPFYLFAVWWLIRTHGIVGAAIAWVMRVAIDMVILFVVAKKILPKGIILTKWSIFIVALAGTSLVVAIFLHGLIMKIIFLFIMLSSFTFVTWFQIMDRGERVVLKNLIKLVR